jgi:hypothetical protein
MHYHFRMIDLYVILTTAELLDPILRCCPERR